MGKQDMEVGVYNTTNPDGVPLAGLTCLDSDASWRKSQHSGSENGGSELARLPNGNIAMRNSNDRDGGTVELTEAQFRALVAGIKDGEFDYLVS